MKTINLTQGMIALVDDEDYEYLSQYKWQYHDGYATTHPGGRHEKRKILRMHSLVLCLETNKYEVDHINGNGIDNRKENLRICTHAENSKNRKTPTNNTSGYKGVSYREKSNKYEVSITCSGVRYFIGSYDNIIDAAKAYDSAAISLHGKYAKTNLSVGRHSELSKEKRDSLVK